MDTKIVQAIWDRNPGPGHPYLGFIDRSDNSFSERTFSSHKLATFPDQPPGQDYFFTPRLFVNGRKNHFAMPTSILYADLDNWKALKPQLHKLWPHVMWLTSADNAQAVWFLDAVVEDESAWADLNQRMTYFMGADKGGWHASKFLRVPGTLNHKYSPPHKGLTVSFQPKAAPYEAEALRDSLPPVKLSDNDRLEAVPTPIPQEEWKAHLAKLWPRLPLRVRSDLLLPDIKDRSNALVRAAHKMRESGISTEDQFHALWWTSWNKFRTDRHEPEYLWQIIQ